MRLFFFFSFSMNLTSSISFGLVLTIRDRSAGLTLQSQRWPKACSIIEAPTLLHFGWASSRQLGSSHHIVAGGTTLAVVDGQLPVLHALTTGAGHPNPLFEAQLLTAGVGGEKNQGRKRRRREGVEMQRKRWWPQERSAWWFRKREKEREREGERLGEDAVNTYFLLESEKSWEQRQDPSPVLSFSSNTITHPTGPKHPKIICRYETEAITIPEALQSSSDHLIKDHVPFKTFQQKLWLCPDKDKWLLFHCNILSLL